MDRPPEPASTLYDQVGGMPFFDQLVATFYEGVSADEILRPLYPEADLAGARRRLALFLAQYWGGPPTYNLERGHPRLRARHFPFWIGPAARERWLLHMRRAVEVSDRRGTVLHLGVTASPLLDEHRASAGVICRRTLSSRSG